MRGIFLPVTFQVLITHVVDATMFYARLLEYRRNEASAPVAMETTQLGLALDIALWFGDPGHRVTAEVALAGDLCALEDPYHIFHRVKVQRSRGAHRDVEVCVQ